MNAEVQLIKIAWRFVDNYSYSYQHILYSAKGEDMGFQAYVMQELGKRGVGQSVEEREKIAFYVCEHFGLLD